MDESALARSAARGDQPSLVAIIERYRRYIYAIAWKIVMNEEDALDVTQNVYARLVERIGAFRGEGSLKGWIGTIAAREAIDFTRRPARRERPTEPGALTGLIDRAASGGNHARASAERGERRGMIEAAMAGLSPQQRAIFALKFHEDLGPREIAERLGIPARQVRSQLARAIARLRAALAEERVVADREARP